MLKSAKILLVGLTVIPLFMIVVYSTINNYSSDKYPVTLILNIAVILALIGICLIGYKSVKDPSIRKHHAFLIILYLVMIALPVYWVADYYKEPITNNQMIAILVASFYIFVLFFNISAYLSSKKLEPRNH